MFDGAHSSNQSMKPTAPPAMQLQRVCRDTLPWLISISLDGTEPMSHATVFFENPEQLRDWSTGTQRLPPSLSSGSSKTGTGCAGLTWPQAVDEALCVGWIDGVRHRIDDKRYKIRFTPRKPKLALERGEHSACSRACRTRADEGGGARRFPSQNGGEVAYRLL